MGHYFRYVIGEVLLVVIGILIALQIDNWNDDRQEAETLDSYLNSISRNIGSDLVELKDLREQREANLLNGIRTSFLFNKAGPYLTDEVIFFTSNVQHSKRALRFIPDMSGYEALKSSGVLDRLQGEDIERLLSDYYDMIGKIQYLESDYNAAIRPLGSALYDQISLEDTESWAIFNPDVLPPQRFQERQPFFRKVINGPSIRLLFSLQSETIRILREYEKASSIGAAFMQMAGSGQKSFDQDKNFHPLLSGPAEGEGKAGLIVNGAIAFDSYGLGLASSQNYGQEFTIESVQRTADSLRLSYPGGVPVPGGEQWAGFWITLNDLAAGRPHLDFSRFNTLQLELKGESGGESMLVHMKDSNDPDDGSQTNIELVLSDQWQTFDIELERFESADLENLFVVVGFLFIDQFEPVTFRIRNARFISR